MKPGFWPDLAKMQDTIKRAGYTPIPEKIDLRATGKLVKQEDHLMLELDGMKSPLILPLAAGSSQLTERLGQTVELEGRWQPPPSGDAGPGTLTVAAVRPPGPPEAK